MQMRRKRLGQHRMILGPRERRGRFFGRALLGEVLGGRGHTLGEVHEAGVRARPHLQRLLGGHPRRRLAPGDQRRFELQPKPRVDRRRRRREEVRTGGQMVDEVGRAIQRVAGLVEGLGHPVAAGREAAVAQAKDRVRPLAAERDRARRRIALGRVRREAGELGERGLGLGREASGVEVEQRGGGDALAIGDAAIGFGEPHQLGDLGQRERPVGREALGRVAQGRVVEAIEQRKPRLPARCEPLGMAAHDLAQRCLLAPREAPVIAVGRFDQAVDRQRIERGITRDQRVEARLQLGPGQGEGHRRTPDDRRFHSLSHRP
jgi:hypothetical protein